MTKYDQPYYCRGCGTMVTPPHRSCPADKAPRRPPTETKSSSPPAGEIKRAIDIIEKHQTKEVGFPELKDVTPVEKVSSVTVTEVPRAVQLVTSVTAGKHCSTCTCSQSKAALKQKAYRIRKAAQSS